MDILEALRDRLEKLENDGFLAEWMMVYDEIERLKQELLQDIIDSNGKNNEPGN